MAKWCLKNNCVVKITYFKKLYKQWWIYMYRVGQFGCFHRKSAFAPCLPITRLSTLDWSFPVAFPSIPVLVLIVSTDHPYEIPVSLHSNLKTTYPYHTKSTKPPCCAIKFLTRLAYSTELSPSFCWTGGKYHTSQTIAQLVIILNKYCPMESLLLFQKASPKRGSYLMATG